MSPDHQKERVTSLEVALGTTLFFLAFLSPVINSLDGLSMLAVTESLVRHGSVAVPKSLGIPGVGGLYYSWWYPLLSVIAAPFVICGFALARLSHLPPHFVAAAFASVLPAVLIGVTTGLVVRIAARLGAGGRASVIAAIAFAFGIALVYAREFMADPLLALVTAAAIYFELGPPRELPLIGLCTALAVLAKPTGIVVGPVIAIHAVLVGKSARAFWTPVISTVIGLAIYFVYNDIRFGNALSFGPPGHFL